MRSHTGIGAVASCCGRAVMMIRRSNRGRQLITQQLPRSVLVSHHSTFVRAGICGQKCAAAAMHEANDQ